jgi:LPXTG-motif cell wall-anchored protein
VVNGCVKSIGRNGISLSTAPGFYQPHVQIIPREHVAQVLAGPERADNIWWWRLRAETGAEGWGNQDEMTPDPGPCAFGGSVSPGLATPPYPVTIVPSFSFAQTPAAGHPPAQATPSQQEALPQTGSGPELWLLAGLLAVTVIVAGSVRRRLQAQSAVRGTSPGEDAEPRA